jgi:hypothetical protein
LFPSPGLGKRVGVRPHTEGRAGNRFSASYRAATVPLPPSAEGERSGHGAGASRTILNGLLQHTNQRCRRRERQPGHCLCAGRRKWNCTRSSRRTRTRRHIQCTLPSRLIRQHYQSQCPSGWEAALGRHPGAKSLRTEHCPTARARDTNSRMAHTARLQDRGALSGAPIFIQSPKQAHGTNSQALGFKG